MNDSLRQRITSFRTAGILIAGLSLCAAFWLRPCRASETAPPAPLPPAVPAAPAAGEPAGPRVVEIPPPEEGNNIQIDASGTGVEVPPEVRAAEEKQKKREADIRQATEDSLARPADPEPVERLVNLHIEAHEGKKSLEAAEKFVAANPGNARGLLNLGRALFWNGDLARAGLQFERVVAAVPADPEPKIWLARVLSMTGEDERAEKTIEAALALAPKNQDTLLVRGRVQESRKEFGAAAKTWERLVAAKYDAGVQDTVLLARAQMCAALGKKQPLALTWAAGPSVTLDVMTFQGVPGVKLRLNQKVEKFFVIDFSAQDIVLTQATAAELQLSGFGGPRLQDKPDVAEYAYVDYAILDTVQAGPLLVQNVPVSVNPGLRYPHPLVGGLIGRRFLSEFLATIDFPARKFTLAPVPAAPIAGEPIMLGNAAIIQARYGKEPAGQWLLDTSTFTPGPVSILWLQERLGINAMSEGVRPVLRGPYIFTFTMPEIEAGGVNWRSFSATGVDLRSVSERLGVELSGILAISLLNDTRITLDLAHNRVHLERVREQTWKSPSKVPPPRSPSEGATQAPAPPAP